VAVLDKKEMNHLEASKCMQRTRKTGTSGKTPISRKCRRCLEGFIRSSSGEEFFKQISMRRVKLIIKLVGPKLVQLVWFGIERDVTKV